MLFFFRCCRKNLQCRSTRFFRLSSTEVVFRLTPACFRLLGMQNINQPRHKIMIPRYWSIKNASRRLPWKFTDQGLKKKYQPMTPIQHFLIDIIQILFRDWIEDTIADISRCKAATDIFLTTLRNYFYERWPILFFNGRGFYFVRCCRRNFNVCRLGLFVPAQPE